MIINVKIVNWCLNNPHKKKKIKKIKLQSIYRLYLSHCEQIDFVVANLPQFKIIHDFFPNLLSIKWTISIMSTRSHGNNINEKYGKIDKFPALK